MRENGLLCFRISVSYHVGRFQAAGIHDGGCGEQFHPGRPAPRRHPAGREPAYRRTGETGGRPALCPEAGRSLPDGRRIRVQGLCSQDPALVRGDRRPVRQCRKTDREPPCPRRRDGLCGGAPIAGTAPGPRRHHGLQFHYRNLSGRRLPGPTPPPPPRVYFPARRA